MQLISRELLARVFLTFKSVLARARAKSPWRNSLAGSSLAVENASLCSLYDHRGAHCCHEAVERETTSLYNLRRKPATPKWLGSWSRRLSKNIERDQGRCLGSQLPSQLADNP